MALISPFSPMYKYPPQQNHYSANISAAHYPPAYQPRTPNQPQRPPLNWPQNPPIAQPRPNTTLNTNQNTNYARNFLEKKLVEFTPISISYVDLLSYLLNNAMVAISQSKIPHSISPRIQLKCDMCLSWGSSGAFHWALFDWCSWLRF